MNIYKARWAVRTVGNLFRCYCAKYNKKQLKFGKVIVKKVCSFLHTLGDLIK